jgi:GDP/UDP-N,N'-diacetylbacillosamine 2-epimerase (hydrolysing)
MEIAILTSSRADFGFYKPLLEGLKKTKALNGNLVVFGTHISKKHGYTIEDIKKSGYKIFSIVDVVPAGDGPEEIVKTIGSAHLKFAEYWQQNKFDLIICLGDRYEMFAAVSASVPFNIPVVHISGGEETFGAIDNIYRHSLTLIAKYHFTNTKKNAKRVKQISQSSKHVYYTGSMAIDNIHATALYKADEFKKTFNFELTEPFVLFTFHPETVDYKKNITYAYVIKETLLELKKNVLVTMPNADTMGNVIREQLHQAAKESKLIHLVESLGSKGYYTALKYCDLVLGNSSSGIVEAASFGKYVINIGNRQLGREHGPNVVHCEINKIKILDAIKEINKMPNLGIKNIYGDGKASNKILNKLKHIANEIS